MSSAPQSISGFPEYLPAQQIVFQSWLQKITQSFEKYGFSPIETPAVERLTTLVSKGAAEHEIYTLSRYREQSRGSGEEFGLRFDLTVPLARYVAQYFDALTFPFKRHHIAPVWRGERPQKGRYRQFYQCDVDILGSGSLSVAHDAEILDILVSTLEKLEVGNFTVYLNHKKMLMAILTHYSVATDSLDSCFKVLDKRLKISAEKFEEEMAVMTPRAAELMDLLDQCSALPIADALQKLKNHDVFQESLAQEAWTDLTKILQSFETRTLKKLSLNLSLARGLGYYTGVIFETFLHDAPGLGSVASGGRYDNLSEQFSNRKMPGVGMSIGVSRLFHHFVLDNVIQPKKATKAKVLLTTQDPACIAAYQKLARHMREADIYVEHYLEDKNLGVQIKYADKKGFEYIIMARAEEVQQGQWIVKNLETGLQNTYTQESLVQFFKTL